MKLFGREPALWIGAIAAILGFLVTLSLPGLTAGHAANILAVVTAVGGLMTAWQTRPWSLGLFGGLIGSLAVLGAGYGLDVSAETVAAVQMSASALLALLTRAQVSPKPDLVPEAAHYLRNQRT
jgi:asparagine N-glycosylation enzyme membrane subunit Stt3